VTRTRRIGSRSRLRRMLVAVPLAFTVLAVGAGTAEAHSGSHWWPTDGCTSAPELYFNHACVHHDGCYAYHWADRGTCDQWFLNDMMATCRSLPFEMVAGCATWAYAYYGAVRAFGGGYYNSPQVATRISVPTA
jgi:hypothetical protein